MVVERERQVEQGTQVVRVGQSLGRQQRRCVCERSEATEVHRQMVHGGLERCRLAHVAGLNEPASHSFAEPGANGDEAGPSKPTPPGV